VHLDETLRVPGGLESPHSSLPLTSRLMRVLGTVVQVPVLPVSNARHHDSFGGSVAVQLIVDDYSRSTTAVNPQQPAKETHRREPVALFLHENIDHNTVLIDSAPEIMPHAVNVEEHLIPSAICRPYGPVIQRALRRT
jgi:hypothetical protein